MPPILVYERNKAYVMEQFHNGHFDYVEVVQEVAQRDFFRYVASGTLLERLAESYPWPRRKCRHGSIWRRTWPCVYMATMPSTAFPG